MPPSSIWQAIAPPIREGIAIGLLANDVVGFQTDRYAHNFLRMVESFVPDATVDYEKSEVRRRRRTTRVRTYPISIDVEATRRIAGSRAARRRADQLLGGTRERVIVRVDRLEPSKNILRGFLAYEALLQRHSRLRGRISFLAFLVPSRTGLREYGHYGRMVQNAVDRINARFGRAGWRPIQLFYENDYAQALAGLSIADVVLVNPLVDGMNLVAKEAAVVSGRDAVLVLSETAGAFDQMANGALPVAPADVAGTADALAAALAMPAEERRRRLAAAASRRRARGHHAGGCAASSRILPSSLAEPGQQLGGLGRRVEHDIGRGSDLGKDLVIRPAHGHDRRARAAPRLAARRRRSNMSRSVVSSPMTSAPRRPNRSTIARAAVPLSPSPGARISTIIRPCPIRRPSGSRSPRAARMADRAASGSGAWR